MFYSCLSFFLKWMIQDYHKTKNILENTISGRYISKNLIKSQAFALNYPNKHQTKEFQHLLKIIVHKHHLPLPYDLLILSLRTMHLKIPILNTPISKNCPNISYNYTPGKSPPPSFSSSNYPSIHTTPPS